MPTLENVDGASLAGIPGVYSRGISAGAQMAAQGRNALNSTRQMRMQREATEQNEKRQMMIEKLIAGAFAGNEEALNNIMSMDHGLGETIYGVVTSRNKAAADKITVLNDRIGAVSASALSAPTPEVRSQIYTAEAEKFVTEGNESAAVNAYKMAEWAINNPERFDAEARQDMFLHSNVSKLDLPKAVSGGDSGGFEQASKKGMLGYVFNKDTGVYSIDPALKVQLDKQAEALAGKENLTPKDVAGVNNKITALTSGVRGIHTAANDLVALEKSSSPSAQLAAIFKFMKALDPTSVVREGEQQMARETGGPADYLVGIVNQIRGEGGLPPEVFSDMVNTSRILANSAIDSAGKEVSSYLGPIEDNLTLKQVRKLRERVPSKYEEKRREGASEVTTQAEYDALPSGSVYTENGRQYRKP